MIFIYVILLSVSLILYIKYIFTYWQRKGIPFITPEIPFGNTKSVIFKKKQSGIGIYDLYKSTTEKFIGIYLFYKPAILFRDPELVKQVLITDFASFHDRGTYCNEKIDPMSGNLFCLPGSKWKDIRAKLTPAFTSGKLKGMFSTIMEVGYNLEKSLMSVAEAEKVIDVKEDFMRFTLDVVASVIFGLDVSTIHEPDSIFAEAINKINHPTFIEGFQISMSFLCPGILQFLRMPMFTKRVCEIMQMLSNNTISHRENSKVVRNDLMQLLIQLRNTGNMENVEEFLKNKQQMKSLSVNEIAAQILVFYIAGTETSSSTMSFCLHELAQKPELMKILQNEIDSVLEKNNGEITYESILGMNYLDQCIKETLRKYPGLPNLNRECTKDYKIPNTNFTIVKGTPVVISLIGIHRDSEFYSDPENFDPERFSEENKVKNERYYFPFGAGPRLCIAYRMGRLVSKIGLVMMLAKYNFEAIDNKEIEFDAGTITLLSKGGIKLKISKRK